MHFYFHPETWGNDPLSIIIHFLSKKPFVAFTPLKFTMEPEITPLQVFRSPSFSVHHHFQVFQLLNFRGFIWVFPKIGVPQNGWFIMENPIKWMIWGENPLFSETSIYITTKNCKASHWDLGPKPQTPRHNELRPDLFEKILVLASDAVGESKEPTCRCRSVGAPRRNMKKWWGLNGLVRETHTQNGRKNQFRLRIYFINCPVVCKCLLFGPRKGPEKKSGFRILFSSIAHF